MAVPIRIPLFPLNTVLFPGGVLPLKIFEARYVDMVRDCMKEEIQFGVVLIRSGQEVGTAAEPEAIGCLAQIVDWDMPQLGVLMLRTEGGQRFRILQSTVLPDQRIEAEVEMIAPDPVVAPSNPHIECARALKLVIDDINRQGKTEQGDEFESPFPQESHFDDAAWVANRWCEILPISLQARQKLLELEGAGQRMAVVHQFLKQHEILPGSQ